MLVPAIIIAIHHDIIACVQTALKRELTPNLHTTCNEGVIVEATFFTASLGVYW